MRFEPGEIGVSANACLSIPAQEEGGYHMQEKRSIIIASEK
jgi:hypothetical protein